MESINSAAIRLIALDIDGTLVNDQKAFPEDLGLTIDALHSKGIKVVIASGRSYMALKRDFDRYDHLILMAENGGFAIADGQTIVATYLDIDNTQRVLQALAKMGVPAVMSGLNHGYVLANANQAFFDHIKVYYDAKKISALNQLAQPIFKVSAFDWQDARTTIYDHLSYMNDTMDVVVAGQQWVDFNPKHVNKGTGLVKIMEKYGLSKDQCMAFGDQENDLTMLQSVKYGFAMKNATDQLKRIAHYMTEYTNNENGCIKTIRQLFDI